MMIYHYYNGFGFGNYGPGFGLLGWVLGILFWALIIFGLVEIVIHLARGGGHYRFHDHGHGHFHEPHDSPNRFENNKNALDILKERYAKGEINKEQFDTMKKDIE